jgi:hypothetical protein
MLFQYWTNWISEYPQTRNPGNVWNTVSSERLWRFLVKSEGGGGQLKICKWWIDHIGLLRLNFYRMVLSIGLTLVVQVRNTNSWNTNVKRTLLNLPCEWQRRVMVTQVLWETSRFSYILLVENFPWPSIWMEISSC